MKKTLLFPALCLLALLYSGTVKAQASGGPDPYGYTYATTPYAWYDISTTGNPVVGLGDDNQSGLIDIGFDFPFYWNKYNQVIIGSNGYLMFGRRDNIASGATGFPKYAATTTPAAYNNTIGALLSDLTLVHKDGTPVPEASVYYQALGTKFIVSFINVPYWSNAAYAEPNEVAGHNTFQFVLDSQDSTILLQYQSVSDSVSPAYTGNGMFPAQIGIEAVNGGTVGLSLRNFTRTSYRTGIPALNGTAFKITPPTASTYVYKDMALTWLQNEDNGGFFKMKQTSMTVKAKLSNAGTFSFTNRTIVKLKLRDSAGVVIPLTPAINDTTLTMPRGQTKIITFRVPLQNQLPYTGNYLLTATLLTAGQSTGSAANDTITEKLIVTDTVNQEVKLDYSNHSTANYTAAIGPAGIYFEPPFYPATVKAVEFLGLWPDLALQPSVADSFVVLRPRLYSGAHVPDSSTKIDSWALSHEGDYTVDSLAGAPSGYKFKRHILPLTTPYTLTSGGLYLGLENSAFNTNFIYNGYVRDTLRPHSLRTYEVTGGIWSPNRDRAKLDYVAGLILVAPAHIDSVTSVHVKAENLNTLGQNYPNPTGQVTNIPFFTSQPGPVTVEVTDMTGRSVYFRNFGEQAGGKQVVQIDLGDLQSGVYSYTLTNSAGRFTRRLVKQQ